MAFQVVPGCKIIDINQVEGFNSVPPCLVDELLPLREEMRPVLVIWIVFLDEPKGEVDGVCNPVGLSGDTDFAKGIDVSSFIGLPTSTILKSLLEFCQRFGKVIGESETAALAAERISKIGSFFGSRKSRGAWQVEENRLLDRNGAIKVCHEALSCEGWYICKRRALQPTYVLDFLLFDLF